MDQMNKQELTSLETLSHDVVGLDGRMTGVEQTMRQLVADTMENRQQLGTLIQSVSTLSDNLKSQGEKLDTARTQRIPASTYIAGALLTIALLGGVLWPTNRDLQAQYQTDLIHNEILRELSNASAERRGADLHILNNVEAQEKRLLRIENLMMGINNDN